MGRTKKQQRGSTSAAAPAATGNEKEKRAETGRDGGRLERLRAREHRKEAAREEGGAAAPAAGEQFFKVFFPEQSGDRLKIPPPFHEYVEEAPNRVVSLKGPSGHTWKVVLTSGTQGLGFTQGWKEFARDHSLVSGHFLVFTYGGHSEFSVAVFSSSGVKDKSALKVQPPKETIIKQEEEEVVEDVDVGGTPEASDLPLVEGDGRSRRKRVRPTGDVMASGTASKRHSSVQKKPEKRKPEATVGTSNAAPRVIDSNQGYVSLLDELSCSNKTRIRSKDVPKMGKFVSKKFRQPVVISQRRLVTEEEKNHALERAKEFKSRHPFAVQVMMESYVYVGFFMNIPCEFVRVAAPNKQEDDTLGSTRKVLGS